MQIVTTSPFKPGQKVSRVQLLKAFFFREGQDTTSKFMGEVKALTVKDRQEMAQLIAKEYGCEVQEVLSPT